MAAANIVSINEQNFTQEVLQSPVPVLVDFWAEWCGPCKMIAPLLDELAGDYDGKVKTVKVNVDENQGLAGQFQVRSIPTLLIFSKGQVTEQMIGGRSKQALKATLDRALAA